MVRPAAALIAKRPDDDGRMILVPLDHPDRALHEGRIPGRNVREIAAQAVRFEIGFIDQIDAVLVTEVIPSWVVGIVRRSYGVDIMRLEQLDVRIIRLTGIARP